MGEIVSTESINGLREMRDARLNVCEGPWPKTRSSAAPSWYMEHDGQATFSREVQGGGQWMLRRWGNFERPEFSGLIGLLRNSGRDANLWDRMVL